MTDRDVVKRVVNILGLLAVLGILGIIGLAAWELPIPDVLQNVTIGSMTATGALLAKTGTEPAGPAEVQVMNEPAEAVPVQPPG